MDDCDDCVYLLQRVRSGEWKGYTGKAITDVVNVGIGGSDLVSAILQRYHMFFCKISVIYHMTWFTHIKSCELSNTTTALSELSCFCLCPFLLDSLNFRAP